MNLIATNRPIQTQNTSHRDFLDIKAIASAQENLLNQGYCVLPDLETNVETILKQFGTLMPQHSGELVYSVRALPGFDKFSDSKSQNRLKPHTDGSDCNRPPRLLALYGIQPACCGGGYTQIVDILPFIQSLDEKTQQQLKTRVYTFTSKKGLHASRSHLSYTPLLSQQSDRNFIFRFSENLLLYGDYSPTIDNLDTQADSWTKQICKDVVSFFQKECISLLVERNSLLIIDNWRMLHSRTQYRDPHRHLLRYWLS